MNYTELDPRAVRIRLRKIPCILDEIRKHHKHNYYQGVSGSLKWNRHSKKHVKKRDKKFSFCCEILFGILDDHILNIIQTEPAKHSYEFTIKGLATEMDNTELLELIEDSLFLSFFIDWSKKVKNTEVIQNRYESTQTVRW